MRDDTGAVSERTLLERHVVSLRQQLSEAIEEQARYMAETLLATSHDEATRAEFHLSETRARVSELRAALEAETARLRRLRSS